MSPASSSTTGASTAVVATSVRPCRSVRFNSRTRIFPTLHLNDMSREEIRAAYATEEDNIATQRGVVEDIRFMRASAHQQSATSNDDHCARGLERFASALTAETAKNARLHVIDGVLDEQDRQDEGGFFDENELARASRTVSRRSIDHALTLAATDEAYVNLHVRRPEVEATLNHALTLAATDETFANLPVAAGQEQATGSSIIRRASDLSHTHRGASTPSRSTAPQAVSPKNALGETPSLSIRPALAGSRRSSAPPTY